MSESKDSFREIKEMEAEADDDDMEEDTDSDDEEKEENGSTEETNQSAPQVHLPDQPLEDGEELVMDEQAYLVYHQVSYVSIYKTIR